MLRWRSLAPVEVVDTQLMVVANALGESAPQFRVKNVRHWWFDCNAAAERALSGLHRRLALLANPHDLIENPLCHFQLGGLGNFDNFVVSDDGDFIALGIETYI